MSATRSFLGTIAAACCAGTARALRRRSPTRIRPVKFIVGFPPGGSTDVGARVIAEYLSRVFAQQIYVENKSGATGSIGTEAAAKSPPDGYTVLIAPDLVVSNPHVFKMNIDVLKDLVPVIQLSRAADCSCRSSLTWRQLARRIHCSREAAAGNELCERRGSRLAARTIVLAVARANCRHQT